MSELTDIFPLPPAKPGDVVYEPHSTTYRHSAYNRTPPLTDADHLLRAILENPDEDTPRLMYADEIELSDPERAEFIRVQCEIARRSHLCFDTFRDLRHRESELLADDYPDSKLGSLLPMPRPAWVGWESREYFGQIRWRFERGFLDWIRLPASAWVEKHSLLLSRHPIRKVEICDWPTEQHILDARMPGETGASTYFRVTGEFLGGWESINFTFPELALPMGGVTRGKHSDPKRNVNLRPVPR
jgi:uncharacterized protein (TIGR02996 family)